MNLTCEKTPRTQASRLIEMAAEHREPIYSDKHPAQAGGDMGCVCRTCRLAPAVYLDQCQSCREKSTVSDDREYLRPGGEWDRRKQLQFSATSLESNHRIAANRNRPALEWYSHRAEWIEENSVAITERLGKCLLPEQFTAFGRWLKDAVDAYDNRKACDADAEARIKRSS
jgi:hypothetical protein